MHRGVKDQVREAVAVWKAKRDDRLAQEVRWFEFEPTTLRVRVREAWCILVAHRWQHGMATGGETGHSWDVRRCLRCGIHAYGQCFECSTEVYDSFHEEDSE